MEDVTREGRARGETAGGAGSGRRRPGLGRVFLAQLRLVARRRYEVVAMTLLVAGSVMVLASDVFGVRRITLAGAVAGFWTWGGIIALFWSFAITWREEGPSERAYHWSLPVDRALHQLLRTAAGGVLLVAVLLVGLLVGWAGGAVIQGGMAPGDPAVLAGLLPAATVLYLVGGLFALLTDRPLLWLVVAYVAVGGARVLAALAGWGWLGQLVTEIFSSGPLSLAAAGGVPRAVSGALGGSSVAASPWQAVGLWLVAGVGLTVAAAALHLEREGRG